MKISVKVKDTAKLIEERGLQQMQRVQKYVDSEVLRLSDPYVPFDTGKLKQSGTLGTVIGSGEVVYNCPYARKNYYENAGRGRQGTTKYSKHNYKCLRGKLWFERMKADHMDEILDGCAKLSGGKAKK